MTVQDILDFLRTLFESVIAVLKAMRILPADETTTQADATTANN